jgi:phosphatidylglycerophosphatase A
MTAKDRRDRRERGGRPPETAGSSPGDESGDIIEDAENAEEEAAEKKGTYLPPGSWTDMEDEFPVGLTREKESPEEAAERGSDASRFLFELRLEIATLFGFGLFPVASGTIGSAATMAIAFMIAELGEWTFVVATAAAIGLAFWSAGAGAAHYRSKDPRQVVIDEAAGQMLALVFVPITVLGWASAFLLFRFFDIVKPPPAAQLERVRGAAGIVLDDLAAGIYANLCVQAILRVAGWKGWL